MQDHQQPITLPRLRWDIFCTVIDNYGDAGVCWRLAKALASCGQTVRLWMDDLTPLTWMAPEHMQQGPTLDVRHWQGGKHAAVAPDERVGDVVIEAFGCEPPDAFVALMAAQAKPPTWINLEYLSAEPYVERCHRLPSPVTSGAGRGMTKHFFYPGFTERTGGLLRPHKLVDCTHPSSAGERSRWLSQTGQGHIPAVDGECWVSLFCYEPAALTDLLPILATQRTPHRLWVTHGRAHAHVADTLKKITCMPPPTKESLLSISYLPALNQVQYDALLDLCDVNFVRGEDSVVRALWSGRPTVWHIYPQHDGAHWAKLDAYLDMLQAGPSFKHWHLAWNGAASASALDDASWQLLCEDNTVRTCRDRLADQPNLVTQLLEFVARV